MYSDEEIKAAKELTQLLDSFNNKDLSLVANTSSVTDKSRGAVILQILIKEYGDEIITKNLFNPFGDVSKLCKVTDYRKGEQSASGTPDIAS
jgi:NAD-dependent SIR2 family protein deacetylase